MTVILFYSVVFISAYCLGYSAACFFEAENARGRAYFLAGAFFLVLSILIEGAL